MIPGALILIVVLPVAGSLITLLLPVDRSRKPAWIAIGCLALTSLLLFAVAWRLKAGTVIMERYPMGPDVSFNLLADGLSLPIALIVNLICLALAIYSMDYIDHRIEIIYGHVDDRTYGIYYRRFFLLYLFFPSGFMGVALATNLIAVYFFLELLTIVPLYFIMAQFGYSDFITRYRVALMCLYWGIVGALFFLIGIVWAFTQTGSFECSQLTRLSGNPLTIWIAATVLVGLATKLALMPLHVWMPWVHAEHPTCIAGLLAIYANIAAYVAVRVLIIPLGSDIAILSLPLMVIAFATMVYGALLTLAQTDIKRFCACSTISQIAYSVFGIASMTALGIKGGIFYFLSHILGKTILFATAGIVVYRVEKRAIDQLGGLARHMPITATLWFSAAFILAALPPTSGFTGKWLLFGGAFTAFPDDPWGLSIIVAAILSTLLTLVYTFAVGQRIFGGRLKVKVPLEAMQDPPLTMSLPLLALVGVALFMGVFPRWIMNWLDAVIY
jgi:NADH-quinone oxidoreductase subunit M